MSKGVIYILTNPSFPQFVKIGYATNLEQRLRQLNRSEALPYAFRAYATYETDHKLTDKALHDLIDRLNPDLRTVETFNGRTRTKEFFEMSKEEAYAILEAIAKISGTEGNLHRVKATGEALAEEQEAEESRRPKRPPFRFSMVGIEPGEEVCFVSDPEKRVVVVDDKHVQLGNVVTSLTGAARHFLGKPKDARLAGPCYFTYKGEALNDIRDRVEGTGRE